MSVSAYCVRLEGLPFRVTREELVEFFEECHLEKGIEGVHLIMNRDGRASGMGYVELGGSADLANATKLSQKNIGKHSRYANIFECDQEELAWYLGRKTNAGDDKKFRLKMQGLPFRATEYAVAKWFEPISHCSDVEIHLNSDGRPSGEATAFFDSKALSDAALKKDREDMDGRYINIVSESGRALARSGFYVRMSGLPFRATEEEMIDFFKPDADCVSARVIFNREGRPSGEAVAEFESEEQADLAIKFKNREHLGSRFVILSKEDQDPRDAGGSDNGNDGPGSQAGFKIRMGGLPFRATVKEIQDWFRPEAECVHVKVLLNREGRPSGEALAAFETEDEAEKAMIKNKEYMGERFVILTPQY
jgi:RNA recognition motif-containing protein